MIDTDSRIERLEANVRQLRFGLVALGAALTGVLAMSAAPQAPDNITVGRLTASSILVEKDGRKVEVDGSGISLSNGADRGALTARDFRLASARAEVTMNVSDTIARVGVANREDTFSSASISVSTVKGQISTPSVTVTEKDKYVSLLTTGLFPPPKK